MYAYARIRAIRRRAASLGVVIPCLDPISELNSAKTYDMTEQEYDLAFRLLQLGDAIRKVEETYMPHFLCQYLFLLAQKFTAFYENCRIIGHQDQEKRLKLCLATEAVLSKGVSLLNVRTLEEV